MEHSVLWDVKHAAADAAAKAKLIQILAETSGNLTAAARVLRIDRRSLRREIVRLGLRRPKAQR